MRARFLPALAICVLACGEPGPPRRGETDTPAESAATGPASRAPLRPPDSPAPAAPVCAFQPGDEVAFEIIDGIPGPRCARALQGQILALANRAGEDVAIEVAGERVEIAPGATWRSDAAVGVRFAPGVHRLASPFYAGSGPELWVQDSSVVRFGGTIDRTFVSARAIVVAVDGDTLALALDDETRVLGGPPDAGGDVSLVLAPGTAVEVVADMESPRAGTALEIRLGGDE